jgi:ribosomal protein L28
MTKGTSPKRYAHAFQELGQLEGACSIKFKTKRSQLFNLCTEKSSLHNERSMSVLVSAPGRSCIIAVEHTSKQQI